jgi:hypothetical protein
MCTKYFSRTLHLLIISLIAHTLFCQIKPSLTDQNKNWEVWHDKVPISGDIKVGLVNIPISEKKLISNKLYIKYKDNTSKQKKIIIEISSRDGKYEAKLPYTLMNTDNDGIYELELPTKYFTQLKNYNLKDLAILAKIDDGTNANFLCASWQKEFDNNVTLYLNSENATYIMPNINGKAGEKKKCDRILEKYSVSYNCKCDVTIDATKGVSNYTILQRSSSASSVSYNSYKINVVN